MTAHINFSDALSPRGATPDEWLPAISQLTQYANTLGQRSDLAITIGPAAGHGAPACFIPSRAEIEINSTICLPNADPGSIDTADALWRLENAAFMGAAGHEIAHSAHTRWSIHELQDTGKISDKIIDVILTLEEPRCESKLIQRAPGQKQFLRAAALDLILADFTLPQTTYGAAAAAALVLARVDGRTLLPPDGAPIKSAILTILSPTILAELQILWQEFLTLGDRNLPGMYSIASRWLTTLGEDKDSTDGLIFTPQPSKDISSGSSGDWIRSAVGTAAVNADSAIIVARANERTKRKLAADEADAHRRTNSAKAAAEAFPAPAELDPNASGPPIAHKTGERRPTPQEQRAATILSQKLLASDNRNIPDIGRTTRHTPPGRLRSRAATQAAAYRDLGLRGPRPELFKARVYSPEQRGKLSIALLSDVSGSMQEGVDALSSVHWMLSHAGHRAGARTCAIHFGAAVHGISRPGQLDENVQLYEANDPWENFTSAALAADHELNLLDGDGARLLVVCSDARFNRVTEQSFATAFMTLCRRKDVAVIWIQITARFRTTYGHGTVLDMQGAAPEEIAVAVGNAAVAQMERSR